MNLDFIAKPLGQFLFFIYDTLGFHNYGLAIIIFTIIIRLLMIPLTIKQYRSTAKMQEIQPQLQEIQKRYKNDKEKLNQEMMKLYQENKVNPAGGCLPLLIQMPVLLSLWAVITKPFTYMLQMPDEMVYGIEEKTKVVKQGLIHIFNAPKASYPEIRIINEFSLEKVGDFLSPELSQRILDLKDGMHFLGLNLGMIPTFDLSKIFSNGQYAALLILPILATATTYISSKLTMPQQSGQQNASAAQMQNTMMFIAPLMTLIFSFQFPAGLSVYWIAGYVIQIFQQMYINKHILKRKEVVSK